MCGPVSPWTWQLQEELIVILLVFIQINDSVWYYPVSANEILDQLLHPVVYALYLHPDWAGIIFGLYKRCQFCWCNWILIVFAQCS